MSLATGDNTPARAGRRVSWEGLAKTIGPGILFAGAAIGGSHLVQSTQAGAYYGWGLLWAVIISNLLKYPFFEFVYRYMNATGENILHGYDRVGRWMLWIVAGIVVLPGILNVTAVSVVTAGLAQLLFQLDLGMFAWAAIISVICFTLITLGRYPALDKSIKIIMGAFALATILAVVLAAMHGSAAPPDFDHSFVWDAVSIAFLLQLMGWMPAPIDVGIWPSIWAEERRKQTQYDPIRPESMTDFYIGYLGTVVMAFFFLGLGALVMYGTGETFAPGGVAFSDQLARLYTSVLGDWSYYLVVFAAFACMFSTTLTCYDGWPRTTHRIYCIIFEKRPFDREQTYVFWAIIGAFVIATCLISRFMIGSMLEIVRIATVVAFLTAPIMAIFNYSVINSKAVTGKYRIGWIMHVLSWLGIIFLSGFALLFAYAWFFMVPESNG